MRCPTRGHSSPSSHFRRSGSAKTTSATRERSILPSGATSAPKRSTSRSRTAPCSSSSCTTASLESVAAIRCPRLADGRRTADRQLLALDALGAQAQPAALRVDLENLDADDVALVDDLARVLDVVLGELGDVDEALDAVEDLDEGAEA